MTPKISVCIPAYNHEKYISKTIDSILNQSFQDFEIIISDDNSSDLTVEIAESYKDDRIKIIKNTKNKGPSVNTNLAISNANGEFIAMIASDDIMEKTRIEKEFLFLEQNRDYGAVFSYIKAIDENENLIEHGLLKTFNKDYGDRFEMLNYFFYRGNFLCAPSCMIRKDVFDKLDGFDENLLHLQDYDLWVRLLVNGYNIKILNEALTFYRVRNDSLSASNSITGNLKILSCEYFEITKILKNFEQINEEQDCVNFFLGKKNNVKKKYFLFILALEALEISKKKIEKSDTFLVHSEAYRNYAIDTLYKIIKNKSLKNDIDKLFHFNSKNFIDIISDRPIIKSLYEKGLKPYRKKRMLGRIINSLKKKLKFRKIIK